VIFIFLLEIREIPRVEEFIHSGSGAKLCH